MSEWISVEDERPDYYKDVTIYDGGKIYYNYHRISDGDNEYYANSNTDDVREGITHWVDIKPPCKMKQPKEVGDKKEFKFNTHNKYKVFFKDGTS